MAGNERLPSTLPMTKNDSATSMRPDPPPTVYSVPEPHPLASCIPTAKTNAAIGATGIMFSWPAFLFGSLCATPKIRLEIEYFSLL